jgi:hypothetical protein
MIYLIDTLQIVKLMSESGLPAPELWTGGGSESLTFAVRGMPASEKSSEKILEILKRNPEYSAKVISNKINMTSRAVEKQMGLLKKAAGFGGSGLPRGDFGKWICCSRNFVALKRPS